MQTDDGRLNFDKGDLIGANVKANHDLQITWQNYKISPPPHNIPKEGILLGHNTYRGETKEIRMKNEDVAQVFELLVEGKSTVIVRD